MKGFKRHWCVGALLLFWGSSLYAAQPPPRGGILRLGSTQPAADEDPFLADRPLEVAQRSLVQLPLCTWTKNQQVRPVLLNSAANLPSNTEWNLSLRPTPSGAPAATHWSPERVKAQWDSLLQSNAPYRGLLQPMLDGSGQLAVRTSSGGLSVTLRHPWPELSEVFCHPALWVSHAAFPHGPFRKEGDGGNSNPFFPLGRPYVDGWRWVSQRERATSRQLRLGLVDVALGLGTTAVAGHPYRTYLGLAPSRRDPKLREALTAAMDVQALARGFVSAPAIPLRSFLGEIEWGTAAQPQVTGKLPAELTLLLDASSEDARSVAERLQLQWRELGCKLVFKSVSRADLWKHWASGTGFDLALLSVLMPPAASNALAVLLELGQLPTRASELASLGTVEPKTQRQARAMERATALSSSLPLIPLYAQGLALSQTEKLRGLWVDAQSVPHLDDVYFALEP